MGTIESQPSIVRSWRARTLMGTTLPERMQCRQDIHRGHVRQLQVSRTLLHVEVTYGRRASPHNRSIPASISHSSHHTTRIPGRPRLHPRSPPRTRLATSISNPLLEQLPTHRTFALTGLGGNPVADAVHVEAMRACPDDCCSLLALEVWERCMRSGTDRTILAGIFTFRAGSLELHAADAAGVVRFLREIPFPLRDGGVGCVGDFHLG